MNELLTYSNFNSSVHTVLTQRNFIFSTSLFHPFTFFQRHYLTLQSNRSIIFDIPLPPLFFLVDLVVLF